MAANKSNEIRITRVYEAPVKAVWDAWTDPKQAAQWWGPRGFTITTHSKDLRPGGIWHYTMHGPDGTDYPNKTLYHEVEAGKRLVYDHGGNDERKPLFRVTVTFSEVKAGTKMEMTMTLPTPEEAEQTRKFIKQAGGNSTWDRLAEYLETDKDIFVINRSFDAPVETLYEMWTNPEHSSKWMPPTGFTMKYLRAHIKEGGSAFYSMTSENGKMTMYGRANYLKLRRPNEVVYTQQFCDAQENVTRHPMAPTWPETMLTTVRFEAEGPNQARITIQWEPHGNATPEELDTFRKARGGMTQGWTGSFDKLESALEKS